MLNIQRIKTDVLALAVMAVVLFVALSLVSFNPADAPSDTIFPSRTVTDNFCGPTGASVAWHLRNLFGLGVWFVLLVLVSLNVRLFSRTELDQWQTHILGTALALTGLCAGLHLLEPTLGGGPVIGSGGYVGAWCLHLLQSKFTLPGVLLMVIAFFVAGMILSNEIRTVGYLVRAAFSPTAMIAGAVSGILAFIRPGSRKSSQPDDVAQKVKEQVEPPPVETVIDDGGIRINAPTQPQRSIPRAMAREEDDDEYEECDYELPSLDLLEESEEFPFELLAKKARVAANTLEKTFQEFKLNVKVVEVDTGPTVTQFELELEPGLRINKVTALADDLAIALRVPSVRVVQSIPGKNTVGVEVPNDKQVMVRLRELIETCPEAFEGKKIPLYVGKDVTGRPLVTDMAKMPHLLIAGRTGTGKSVCLNTLILSMLMTRTPDQVRMIMIDPKMVELSPYKKVPHLMHPVITDMKQAEAVLAWAVDKMEERYDLLARIGVRHLDGYNKVPHEEILDRLGIDPDSYEAEAIPEHMPYIVIVADEMADLMMTAGKDVEGHIIRLAQKSRAVGIHLVLATQKPTVDVITGLIKSNLPARISFQVASRMDSRVVLDDNGAERLLGNGDLLYMAPGTSTVARAQGTYVSDQEMNDIIGFYSQYEPQYSQEIAQAAKGGGGSKSGGGATDRVHDDRYEDAIEVVIREGRGSVSLIQRALAIGYGRAARLIDYMAEDGIVGEHNGSSAREVLLTEEQWLEQKAQQAA